MAALQLLPQPAGAGVKSIVYGIVDAKRATSEDLPDGLNEERIFAVEEGRLAALVSQLPEELAESAGVEQALLYARVVERLHRRMTILPMRYGCFVYQPQQVSEFLRRHQAEFSDALTTIEGCDEMGVRILLPGAPATREQFDRETSVGASDKAKGVAYLEARRRFYERQAREEQACREWAERAKMAFSGMFRHSSWEFVARPEGTLLSLSFLVERSEVPAFKEVFSRFRREQSVTAICSGPWPPYVFGAGLAKPDMAAQAEAEFFQR